MKAQLRRRDQMRKACRRYYRLNKERIKERSRAWTAANPEKKRQQNKLAWCLVSGQPYQRIVSQLEWNK